MLYFILAAAAMLLDQASKYFLALKLSGGRILELIPGVVHLTYVENTGAAFSLLSDMRWLLVGVSSAAVVLIAVFLLRDGRSAGPLCRAGLAAVLGGAVSNLVDRALFGFVADFFEFEFVRFAVFNVADIFITAGAAMFCACYLFSGRGRHLAGSKGGRPGKGGPGRGSGAGEN